jgi:hypothetical protein
MMISQCAISYPSKVYAIQTEYTMHSLAGFQTEENDVLITVTSLSIKKSFTILFNPS